MDLAQGYPIYMDLAQGHPVYMTLTQGRPVYMTLTQRDSGVFWVFYELSIHPLSSLSFKCSERGTAFGGKRRVGTVETGTIKDLIGYLSSNKSLSCSRW